MQCSATVGCSRPYLLMVSQFPVLSCFCFSLGGKEHTNHALVRSNGQKTGVMHGRLSWNFFPRFPFGTLRRGLNVFEMRCDAVSVWELARVGSGTRFQFGFLRVVEITGSLSFILLVSLSFADNTHHGMQKQQDKTRLHSIVRRRVDGVLSR